MLKKKKMSAGFHSWASSCLLRMESWEALTPPSTEVWWYTLSTATEEISSEPWCPVFIGVLWPSACMLTSVSSPCGGWADTLWRKSLNINHILKLPGEFPGSPVVRTWCFHCLVLSIPGWGTKIPQAAQCSPKTNKLSGIVQSPQVNKDILIRHNISRS